MRARIFCSGVAHQKQKKRVNIRLQLIFPLICGRCKNITNLKIDIPVLRGFVLPIGGQNI